MKVYCKNEFIDRETGVRHVRGDAIEMTEERATLALESDVISLDPVAGEAVADEVPDKSWSVPQLKAYAAANGIELSTRKKDDILAEIALALEADEDGGESETEEESESEDEGGQE